MCMDGNRRAWELIAEERATQTGFLDLGNLGLVELPAELFELTHLRSLKLGSFYKDDEGNYRESANGSEFGENVLAKIPADISGLTSLLVLSLTGNPVSDLTPLKDLPALQSLDCLGTQVSDLTPLKDLTALQSLTCWGTQVSDLTPLKDLTALQSLTCSGTQVSDLTPLKDLTALQSLTCSNTQVSDLTPLKDLTALQSLTCWGTQVSDLTPLKDLTALQSLDCWGTQVSDLTPLKDLTALQSLDCSGTQVSDLTPLKDLTALQSLDCSGTQVSDLTPLKDLTALQSLDCWSTQVSDLTPLKDLTALQSLTCSNTQVSDLTPLKDLTALQSLTCWDTQVSDLTPLKDLTALQSLDCSGTQVSDLTPLKDLTALQSLDCSGTQVSDLTPLKDLTALRRMDMSQCRLSDLPRRLVMNSPIDSLVLHEVMIPGIPVEILSQDPNEDCLSALRDHLRDQEAGVEEIREAKLVVLGNGRVGKTQICRRLRGLPYDEKVPSTHGITVTSERWSGSNEDEALNIWDFGGQDIYHGAHTLFMKTSAVFLVVWHPDFEAVGEQTVEGMVFRHYPLSYWLEYIRTLGRKDCRLWWYKPAANGRSRRPDCCRRTMPSRSFPRSNPAGTVQRPSGAEALWKMPCATAFSFCATGMGSRRLEKAVCASCGESRNGATKIRHARIQPSASTGHSHRREFRNVCAEEGGVSSPESLLAYLHNLGVVFYQPELFHDRIILDQSWALEAVYGVFDRRKAYPLILNQGGRFTPSLLAMTAWKEYGEPERRLFLSLMQACGIAFVHRAEDPRLGLETEYIAPDILPGKDAVAAQLAGRWNDKEESWRLEFQYPFLHPGLMRALLCDVGERSQEAGVYWRYGVWVYEKSTGCRVWLEHKMTDERRGRIKLEVQGRRHEELVRWLRGRIDERNRLFGYPDLAPFMDEFGPALGRREHTEQFSAGRVDTLSTRGKESSLPEFPALDQTGRRATPEPTFDKPPPSIFPPREPQVFVSYAWGDDTPEGLQRSELVDSLCEELRQQGVSVRRDCDELKPGMLISEFMDRLAGGDFIVAVISDKYLRSEYCMYELFRIYRNCSDKPQRFQRKVVPLILADARLGSLGDRLKRAIHWTKQENDLKPLIEGNVGAVGIEFFRKYKLIGEFARNTSNMLEYLVDKLQPRDFDRQAREGFREVLSQVRPVS
jgi:internalin A